MDDKTTVYVTCTISRGLKKICVCEMQHKDKVINIWERHNNTRINWGWTKPRYYNNDNVSLWEYDVQEGYLKEKESK